jgi:hypothetical protein
MTKEDSRELDGERVYTLFMGTMKYLGILLLVLLMGQMSMATFGLITFLYMTLSMVNWADPDMPERLRY